MTVPDWLPGAERHPGEGSGGYIDDAAWKLLLHTTEGPTLAAALSALDAKRAWSHFVYDPNTDHLVQCVPLTQAARALRSGEAAGRTNAAKVIQIEIVGNAATSPGWTEKVNTNLGRLIARLAAVVPFRPVFDLPFYGTDAGFTVASKTARQRLSWDDWYRYDAICGHQHVPANDHWDPGHINTASITRAIGGQPAPEPPKGPLMVNADDEKKIRTIVREEVATAVQDAVKAALSPVAATLARGGEVRDAVVSIKRHAVTGADAAKDDDTVPERELAALARIEQAVGHLADKG